MFFSRGVPFVVPFRISAMLVFPVELLRLLSAVGATFECFESMGRGGGGRGLHWSPFNTSTRATLCSARITNETSGRTHARANFTRYVSTNRVRFSLYIVNRIFREICILDMTAEEFNNAFHGCFVCSVWTSLVREFSWKVAWKVQFVDDARGCLKLKGFEDSL